MRCEGKSNYKQKAANIFRKKSLKNWKYLSIQEEIHCLAWYNSIQNIDLHWISSGSIHSCLPLIPHTTYYAFLPLRLSNQCKLITCIRASVSTLCIYKINMRSKIAYIGFSPHTKHMRKTGQYFVTKWKTNYIDLDVWDCSVGYTSEELIFVNGILLCNCHYLALFNTKAWYKSYIFIFYILPLFWSLFILKESVAFFSRNQWLTQL